MRRTRIGGNFEIGGSVPLGEERELYRVTLFDDGGTPAHIAETDAPKLTLSAPDMAAIFGATPSAVDVEIRQVSARAGLGIPARSTLPL